MHVYTIDVCLYTDRVDAEHDDELERNSCQQVEEEPRLQIVEGDLSLRVNHFAVLLVNEGCEKVEEDV